MLEEKRPPAPLSLQLQAKPVWFRLSLGVADSATAPPEATLALAERALTDLPAPALTDSVWALLALVLLTVSATLAVAEIAGFNWAQVLVTVRVIVLGAPEVFAGAV